ncbi:MAG TPA: PGPGW domain-containing protein [bacterium]|nr:PGPGW domain-containing protein [bacterium]
MSPRKKSKSDHKVHVPKEFQPILNLAWKLVIFVIGVTVVLFGIFLIFTPGPSIIVIPIGLTILATQFLWARKLLKQLKRGIHELRESLPTSRPSKKSSRKK